MESEIKRLLEKELSERLKHFVGMKNNKENRQILIKELKGALKDLTEEVDDDKRK
ncbi:hypothetical protein [Peribacillus frigoritolerans]|uniref:hypothetical protein n=1 Tax=Peribacillus frigoritolerans TaxID=450367 RepID=UPI002E1BA42C|nr:hypothetical protein [Peribacillus frigoritolerans]MED3845581.1 hypothetical protein [Peribacillus frigoritolerans]